MGMVTEPVIEDEVESGTVGTVTVPVMEDMMGGMGGLLYPLKVVGWCCCWREEVTGRTWMTMRNRNRAQAAYIRNETFELCGGVSCASSCIGGTISVCPGGLARDVCISSFEGRREGQSYRPSFIIQTERSSPPTARAHDDLSGPVSTPSRT